MPDLDLNVVDDVIEQKDRRERRVARSMSMLLVLQSLSLVAFAVTRAWPFIVAQGVAFLAYAIIYRRRP